MRRLATAIVGGVLALATATGLAAGASAQTKQGIAIELNKLEPIEGSCRAYFVVRPEGTTEYKEFKMELLVFDTGGIIQKWLAIDAAPLRAGKTSVKLFDVSGVGCDKIGSILLNDVTACADAGGEIAGCVERIAPTSKAKATFYK
ncbi:MAG: Tat pathway signal sequence domain protein [Thalassobaculum sp.]|uniref:Tat pathway signal sequence domain protein n=1 Tax=Thalassobaculum sp. TaxID=2022740 RepID=UPI0032ECA365